MVDKPVPTPAEADRPYWDALAERRVALCRCDSCGAFAQRTPMVCRRCRGESFSWSDVSGRGSIYSFTVARQSWVAGFDGDLPYVVVAVAVEEDPSVVVTTNLVGEFDIDALDVGLPVAAVFEDRGDATLLQFALDRPADV